MLRFFYRTYMNLKGKFVTTTNKNFLKKYGHFTKEIRLIIFHKLKIVEVGESFGIIFEMHDNDFIANIPTNFFIYGDERDERIKFILNEPSHWDVFFGAFFNRASGHNYIFKQPFVAVDMGAFVGDTALFLAANSHVNKVYSYELMPQTYEIALRNIQKNQNISQKIELYNYGLGIKDEEIEVVYYTKDIQGSGIVNDSNSIDLGQGIKTKCEIKNAVAELQRIVAENPEMPLYLKVDVEGAEYDIIEAIFNSNVKENIYYIAIEYHFNIKNLIEILTENDFDVVESRAMNDFLGRRHESGILLGYIQAIRSTKN